MKPTILSAAAAALFLTAFATATPARADCASRVAAMQDALSAGNAKNSNVQAAKNLLEKAAAAAAKGKKKKCQKLADKAAAKRPQLLQNIN